MPLEEQVQHLQRISDLQQEQIRTLEATALAAMDGLIALNRQVELLLALRK